jgi:hypothetical protein
VKKIIVHAMSQVVDNLDQKPRLVNHHVFICSIKSFHMYVLMKQVASESLKSICI